jgi:predicted dehydrogenase
MGDTTRCRRPVQAVKGKHARGGIGDVTSVVTRAFMNRMVPIATIRKTNQRQNLTPMVVSGTHALDMSMYLMEGKTPVSCCPFGRQGARDVGHRDSTLLSSRWMTVRSGA